MGEFIVVTEEQAQQFERAGIPVQIQYTVKVEDMKAPAAPSGQVAKPRTRRTVIGPSVRLRWTNVKYTGSVDTQQAMVYGLLAEYFGRHPNAKPERRAINTYLGKEMMKKGQVFNASVVTYLLVNKYLEVCDA